MKKKIISEASAVPAKAFKALRKDRTGIDRIIQEFNRVVADHGTMLHDVSSTIADPIIKTLYANPTAPGNPDKITQLAIIGAFIAVEIDRLAAEQEKQSYTQRGIEAAKSWYKGAPYATKSLIAIKTGLPFSFITEYWEEIRK